MSMPTTKMTTAVTTAHTIRVSPIALCDEKPRGLADDANGGDQNGNDCQYYQDSTHRSAVPHGQGAKDLLNTRSHTRCPSLRPRVSNFVSGREPALAKPEAVLISEGSDKNTSSICRAYSSQSVQACTVAPGFILEASSATNGGWIRRPFSRCSSAMRFSRLPTPGVCTSTPR